MIYSCPKCHDSFVSQKKGGNEETKKKKNHRKQLFASEISWLVRKVPFAIFCPPSLIRYVCVCIFVCVRVCVRVSMYVGMCAYLPLTRYEGVCICVCHCACMFVCVYVRERERDRESARVRSAFSPVYLTSLWRNVRFARLPPPPLPPPLSFLSLPLLFFLFTLSYGLSFPLSKN